MDRWDKESGTFSGDRDQPEQQHWIRHMGQTGFYELQQPEYTHSGPQSSAKLDRIYTDQYVVDQLDSRVFAAALEETQ